MSRINHQPIFLLSSKAWRENSLWIEAFSCDYGRVALLARSARTKGSELRGVLIPFVPVSASWYGKEELKTLHRAEWLGGWRQPQGQALFSALYINELVLKLTPREDPQPEIYHAMHHVMQTLCTTPIYLASLRQFEFRLLHALGIAPDFTHDEDGAPINPEQHYWVRPEEAVQAVAPHFRLPENQGKIVQGDVLQAIVSGKLQPEQFRDAHQVMRHLIDFRLPEIHTRQVLLQLNQLKQIILTK